MSEGLDYRYVAARANLSPVRKVLLVCSGKGGVGKSVLAASLALALKEKGRKAGLLDLDIHGPSAPLVLRAEEAELVGGRKGLHPVEASGVKLFSLYYYVGDRPVPLRGALKESLLLDILAGVYWGELDYLVVDEPPGTGDELLVTLRVVGSKASAVVVTTPSRLSLSVVRRLVDLLRREEIKIVGLVENMSYLEIGGSRVAVFGESRVNDLGIDLLGRIPLDPGLEGALASGRGVKAATRYWEAVVRVAERIEKKLSR